jgi:hypothetical protein
MIGVRWCRRASPHSIVCIYAPSYTTPKQLSFRLAAIQSQLASPRDRYHKPIMLKVALILPLLTASLTGAGKAPVFARQQFCGQGLEYCGSYCIPNSYTCCPDLEVGCQPGTYCAGLGTNGQPKCCFDGEDCDGPGGINLVPGGTVTSLYGSFSTVISDSTFTSTIVDVFPTSTGSVTSTLTSTSTPTSTDTTTATSTSTLNSTLASASPKTSTPVSTLPVLPSTQASTQSSNVTSRSSAAPTAPPESTGGADSRLQGTAGWLLAFALPVFAL